MIDIGPKLELLRDKLIMHNPDAYVWYDGNTYSVKDVQMWLVWNIPYSTGSQRKCAMEIANLLWKELK